MLFCFSIVLYEERIVNMSRTMQVNLIVQDGLVYELTIRGIPM